MDIQVFNLISKLKGLKRANLIVDKEDEYMLKASYNRVKPHLTYKLWSEIVKNYSIETGQDYFNSCMVLVDVVIKKYEK